ncbi:hypothetical protein BT96DRAFT_981276 [Gymnopus androsaceus JB14]|uniref:Uncharacterized protein n=1 Tax=Gymnopus androsaceus JB14 TaxID=1447944 RepID=A0A6A4GQ95_9AGAR|nr:hypothetical protein BT96DRAFT_981276 [Gymnopus androsaceus JB14]
MKCHLKSMQAEYQFCVVPPPLLRMSGTHIRSQGEARLSMPPPLVAHGSIFPDANHLDIAGSHFFAAQRIQVDYHSAIPPHSQHLATNYNSSSSVSPGLQPDSEPPSTYAAESSDPEHESVPYTKLLLMAGQGIPFWNPIPVTRGAPALFHAEGLLVGDVITLDEEGGYDYLFNIFLPANSERNQFAPEGFEPFQGVDPYSQDRAGMKDGHYLSYTTNLASQSQQRENLYVRHMAHDVDIRQPDGALLVAPKGTILHQLDRRIEDELDPYIRANVEIWYKNTRKELSELNPPELGVITGCHKCSCCLMAVFTNAESSQVKITFTSKNDQQQNDVNYRLSSSSGPWNSALNLNHQRRETIFFRGYWISKKSPAHQEPTSAAAVETRGETIKGSNPIIMPTREMTTEHLKWRLLPQKRKESISYMS